MKKIVITTTSFGEYDPEPLKLLEKSGFEAVLNPYGRKLKKDEIPELCLGAIGIIAGTEKIDAGVLAKLPALKVISRCGSGLDNVDLNAAAQMGVRVFNTPDAPTLAVAELTVGLMLSLLRKVSQMDGIIRSGNWDKLMGNLIFRKKIGIIGFGRIGRKVADLLSVFGVQLAYCDIIDAKPDSAKCSRMSLDEIMKWADIITVHVSTSGMLIGEKELSLMKKGSWVVNVSRGGVVDEKALFAALKNGHLTGAAIDVFEQEPYQGQLRELENIILTPHIGSYAKEARIKMESEAVENLLKGLKST